jgi:predicted HAD superfamily hydrolase
MDLLEKATDKKEITYSRFDSIIIPHMYCVVSEVVVIVTNKALQREPSSAAIKLLPSLTSRARR